jgi:hypothetical protein
MIRADRSGGRLATLRRAVGYPSFGGAAALGFALSWSDPIAAVGLGPVTQQSALGQSLRIVVPVLVSPGENIGAECFRLAASDREVDGAPQLVFGRVNLERTSEGARLVITNAAPVNDPVVRMTVQAGCETAVRREYVLLMDPPPIETPLVAAEAQPRTEMAQAPETIPAAAPTRRARGSAGAATSAAASGSGEAARAARKPAAPAKPRSPAKAAPKRPVRPAGDQPRLTVSSAAPLPSGDPRTANASVEQARAQQELANALEAETVVLQRRIVELTAMVERMQEELRIAEAAQRPSADQAAKAPAPTPSPEPAKSSPWSDQNWLLLSAIGGLPLLIALGLLWRRRFEREAADRWPTARGASPATAPPTHVAPFPGLPKQALAEVTLQNTPAGVAPPTGPLVAPSPPKKVPKRAAVARDSASALAVSELLHVTEEARVYVALGRPERAIDVLNEHVRQEPRSMPAAWLMLLDLYHASGRRQDFRHLAEEFHMRCNVQPPLWESFDSKSAYEEGGLDAFPHVMREITRLWRQPDCRAYLEKLLYDNREGRRVGFPLAAYSEILLLLQILDAPPPVDIDSDLVNDGKLDAVPKATSATVPAGDPPPAEPGRSDRRGPAAPPRPEAQRSLDFEPERGGAAGGSARKLSS